MEEYFGRVREEGLRQEEEVASRPKEGTMSWNHTSMQNLETKRKNIDLSLKK